MKTSPPLKLYFRKGIKTVKRKSFDEKRFEREADIYGDEVKENRGGQGKISRGLSN